MARRWTKKDKEWLGYKRAMAEDRRVEVTLPPAPWDTRKKWPHEEAELEHEANHADKANRED
jgi:hypothetical protein